jgi:hypothetical protein
MVFFHIVDQDGHTAFAVNSYWWLYLAVTIPLTATVAGLWYWMLKRKGSTKLRMQKPESLDLENKLGPALNRI